MPAVSLSASEDLFHFLKRTPGKILLAFQCLGVSVQFTGLRQTYGWVRSVREQFFLPENSKDQRHSFPPFDLTTR